MVNLIQSISNFQLDKLNFNSSIKYFDNKESILIKIFNDKIDKKYIQNYDICLPVNNSCETGVYTIFFKGKSFQKTNNKFKIVINSKTSEAIILTKKITNNFQIYRLCSKFFFDSENCKYIKFGLNCKDLFFEE